MRQSRGSRPPMITLSVGMVCSSWKRLPPTSLPERALFFNFTIEAVVKYLGVRSISKPRGFILLWVNTTPAGEFHSSRLFGNESAGIDTRTPAVSVEVGRCTTTTTRQHLSHRHWRILRAFPSSRSQHWINIVDSSLRFSGSVFVFRRRSKSLCRVHACGHLRKSIQSASWGSLGRIRVVNNNPAAKPTGGSSFTSRSRI